MIIKSISREVETSSQFSHANLQQRPTDFGMVGGFVFDVVSMYQPFACSSFHVYIPTLAAS
jgi:hypothetical protein